MLLPVGFINLLLVSIPWSLIARTKVFQTTTCQTPTLFITGANPSTMADVSIRWTSRRYRLLPEHWGVPIQRILRRLPVVPLSRVATTLARRARARARRDAVVHIRPLSLPQLHLLPRHPARHLGGGPRGQVDGATRPAGGIGRAGRIAPLDPNGIGGSEYPHTTP